MSISAPVLSRLVEAAVRDEHGCEECYHHVDAFAEAQLAGRTAEEAAPLIEAHLAMCPGCRDEFEALLAALRADEAGATAPPAGAPSATPRAPWWQFWRR